MEVVGNSASDESRPQTAEARQGRDIKVFVHLARDKDLAAWQHNWSTGKLVGLNDPTPYGYGRAEKMGCKIVFSKSGAENPLVKFARLALRVIAGFDVIHAYRQRKEILAADVIWTHTESQFLAVAAFLPKTRGPKLIGQSVWLFDRWGGLSPVHRWIYRRLIHRVNVLTFHSPENMRVAQGIFPEKDCRLVPFGIPSETMIPPTERTSDTLAVVSPGSDRHRDWSTLVEALDAIPNSTTTILSGSAPTRLAKHRPWLTIKRAKTSSELSQYFDRASVVCVPLKPNKHASGITVVQEAVLSGVPVVATLTGGLDAYFSHDEIRYVQPDNPIALREALIEIGRDPKGAAAMARRAQERMRRDKMGADSYIREHVTMSREMMSAP